MEQKGDVKVLVATCRAQLSFLHDKTNECGSNSLHWFQVNRLNVFMVSVIYH